MLGQDVVSLEEVQWMEVQLGQNSAQKTLSRVANPQSNKVDKVDSGAENTLYVHELGKPTKTYRHVDDKNSRRLTSRH
ncbi:Uncharacterized protein DAT39_016925 [Clarias magur]|uniref:Uncharacterized protein n=1 Tax=Clarias magur TaxID=1594786 RepID=A0A8J4WVF0_CLAMG|nr:Uncharacterized protein DAT39_016925 [Clarias magur]